MNPGERPSVLLVPGFLGSPPMYGRMADRLLARGAASVAVAPVWTPDWMLAAVVGFGPLMRRTGRAVAQAYRRGGARPLLVVGHSAGGLLARLAMSPEPYQGHWAGVAEAYGALVTLGTPHRMDDAAGRPFGAGFDASRYLDAIIPGAWFAPRTAYLTVGSRFIAGGLPNDPDLRRRIAGRVYALLGGEAARADWGDGLILEASTHLDGARNVILEGIVHPPGLPVPWYGSDEGLDGWWDLAVEAWRDGLRARGAR
ncbi:MAG: PGAP1-like protein [Chloroflexi bacterium CSP1-4]|nr:MAG: PGAP1-like protein [Chloroflexi bacterium CSP1-4]